VNIAQWSVALGIVAIGQTVVVLAGSLDLSVAYVVSVAASTCRASLGCGAGSRRL
jgi:ribose transport system permease protein